MYKVVFADDELIIRNSVSEIIDWEKYGFHLISSASNGVELIEAVDEHKPELVITDINMPYIDGLKASKEIKENHPNVKVVLLTGHNELEYVHEALNIQVSKYILKPISSKKLSELLTEIKKELDDEYNKVLDLRKSKKQYLSTLSSMQNIYLNSIIRKSESNEEVLEKAEMLSLEYLKQNEFVVAIVDIDLRSINSAKISKETAYFALYNIIHETIEREKIGYVILDETKMVILFCLNKDAVNNYERIELILEYISSQINAFYKLSLFIGVGRQTVKTEEIVHSYNEAKTASGYAENIKTNVILNIRDIKKRQRNHISIRDNPFLNIIDELIYFDEQELEAALVNIIKANNLYDINYLKIYINDALLYLLKKAEEYELDTNSIIQNYFIENTHELDDTDEVLNSFKESVLLYSEEQQEIQMSNKRLTLEKALKYISEHYSNSELTLQDVCEYIHLSESYFRAIFKQEMGATFSSYLTMLRMEKARELLIETTLKNYEIAEQVGYSDPHYFSYRFKREHGMTPTKYRESYI